MQSTKKLRGGGTSPNGLTCEIVPLLQLQGAEALRQINKNDPKTYRKVRVYGYLRFGTEASGHSGVKTYDIGSGRTIRGHWEIHPVERIEAADHRGPFKIGPSAKYVSWPISQRYKLNDTNFEKRSASNHARLVGTVKTVTASRNQSGDVDVALEVNASTYTATIPQYYVKNPNANTQTVEFLRLLNFSSINYSLTPSDSKTRTFYGLRSWRFREGEALPALQPVEMIK